MVISVHGVPGCSDQEWVDWWIGGFWVWRRGLWACGFVGGASLLCYGCKEFDDEKKQELKFDLS